MHETRADASAGPTGDAAREADAARESVESPDHEATIASLREAIRVRDVFLAVASRELRNALTPLASLVEFLDMSVQRQHSSTPDEIAPMVGRLASATERFEKRTTLLFEASRLIAGEAYVPSPSTFDFASVVRSAIDVASPAATIVGSSIVATLDEDVVVISDRAALGLIVDTLISNATKFGAGRPIEVTLAYAHDAPEDARVRLSVRDHGIGLSREDQERLFAPFGHIAAGPSAGFGVGLWVAHALAQALGGTLSVESTLGLGASFTATLPLCAPQR
jgi:signal transduction histidine kinase